MSSIKSKILSLSNQYHFIVLVIVLIALSIKHIFFLFVLLFYMLLCFLKNKQVFVVLLGIGILFLTLFYIKELIYVRNNNYENKVFQIIEKSTSGNYYSYIIKSGLSKYQFSSKDIYKVGDLIKVKGEIEKFKIHYPNAFDYEDYLHFQNIKGVINPNEVVKVGHKFCVSKINNLIQEKIINSYTGIGRDYLLTLTLGVDDTLDKNSINKIGISHLFVISGLHVAIIIMFLEFLLKRFKIKNNIMNIIIVLILGLYVLIVNFLISVIRVYINYILKTFFKFNQLDRISINFIIVCILNPYLIFQLSFILSYMIGFFMCIYQEKIITKNNFINKTLNLFILTTLVQLFVLPFVVSINPDFNLIAIIVNPIFIFIVTYIFLPFSFITVIFPIIYPIYSYFAFIFDYLVENIAKIDFLSISLGNTNIYLKSLYYVGFYILLRGYYLNELKNYLFFIIILLLWYYKGIFVLNDQVFFLDLPEGDASLIISKNTSNVILIDTGEVTKNNILTKIIKDLGIKKIDYLIITHGDSDHIGGAYHLSTQMKINNLILNEYDVLEKSYSVRKKAKNVYLLKQDNEINEKDFYIKVLSPMKDYQNINDNSLVFIMDFKGLKILYTGDISTKVENDIINKYKNISIDILKIAHHGSTTSSSINFLKSINYKYAVIMNGYYNTFGFPKKEVVERIPENKRLITKELNTIIFLKRGKGWILKN